MSIPYSGAFGRSGGLISAVSKQLKSINLKGVKRITITFDPFAENATETRDFLFYISTPKVALTNPKCTLKPEIVCNRQLPEVKFTLIDSAKELVKAKEIRFVCDNLSCLDLLRLCNKHITTLAPPEDIPSTLTTKGAKKKVIRKK